MRRIKSFADVKVAKPKPLIKRVSATKKHAEEATILEIAKVIDPETFRYANLDEDELEIVRDNQTAAIKKAHECFIVARRHFNETRRQFFVRRRASKKPEYVLRVIDRIKRR